VSCLCATSAYSHFGSVRFFVPTRTSISDDETTGRALPRGIAPAQKPSLFSVGPIIPVISSDLSSPGPTIITPVTMICVTVGSTARIFGSTIHLASLNASANDIANFNASTSSLNVKNATVVPENLFATLLNSNVLLESRDLSNACRSAIIIRSSSSMILLFWARLVASSEINNSRVKASSVITPTLIHVFAIVLNGSPVSSRLSQIIPTPANAPEVKTPYNNNKSRWSGSINQESIVHLAVITALLFQVGADIYALISGIRRVSRREAKIQSILRTWSGFTSGDTP